MFLVLTTQTARDTTVAMIAPRLVTDNPTLALKAARRIYLNNRETPFISSVIIYELAPGREYTLRDASKRFDDGPRDEVMVFVAWEHPTENRWVENFHGSFKLLNPADQRADMDLSRCVNGTCGHGHAGDPPNTFGGSDF